MRDGAGVARRVLAFGGLASLAAGLVLIPAASRSVAAVTGAAVTSAAGASTSSGTSAVIGGGHTTVTGPRLYDPATGKQLPNPSTVTVSTTHDLVNQVVQVSWTHFTPSTPNNAPGPYYGDNQSFYAAMVTECRGANPKSWNDCYGATNGGVPIPTGPDGPYNTAYAVTTAAGAGQVPFDIQTSQVNTQLGCDPHHKCSLVVVPGQGGDPKNCADHSGDVNGVVGNAIATATFSFNPGGSGPCSWRDRIVIPLHFAPVPSGCPIRNATFSAAGSPMLAGAMQQWLTALCAGRNGLTISYNAQAGEQLAVGEAASGSADVALTTRPARDQQVATGSHHFVYAPIAVTAVSVAYWIDDNNTGQPLSGLKLNQRLLAKLLTTSYDPAFADDKGVKGNPFFIFGDPEFASLDPNIVKNINVGTAQSIEVPTVVQGASDMTWTVTRWIGADPVAGAFLRGKPAPGNMHVNTFYRGVKYPVTAFAAQDPSPEYTRLYNPVFPLSKVVSFQALNEDAGSNTAAPPPLKFTQDPPEPVGNRALFAILDESDAALDHMPVAAIPNGAGRFVTPTNAAMAAALSHMTGGGNGTLQMNLANKDPKAYPLTMVIYAMAPTSGLSHAKAAAIARFIDFATGKGQTPGLHPGQLPPGYLPLTATLRAQARKAASQIANQTGNTATPQSSPTPAATPAPGVSTGPPPTGTPSPSPSISLPGAAASGQPVTLINAAHVRPAGFTRFILPILLILGGLAALAGSSALAGSVPGGIAARLRRMGREATRSLHRTGSRAVSSRAFWRRKP